MLGYVLQFLYGMGNCVWNCRFSSERLLTIGDLQFHIFLVLHTSPRGGQKMTFWGRKNFVMPGKQTEHHH